MEYYSHEFFLFIYLVSGFIVDVTIFVFWLVLLRIFFFLWMFIFQIRAKCNCFYSKEYRKMFFFIRYEMFFTVFGICYVLKMLPSPIFISLCFYCSEKNWSTLQVSFYMANRQIIMLFLYKAQIYLCNTTNISKGYSWFLLNFWCNFGFLYPYKTLYEEFWRFVRWT